MFEIPVAIFLLLHLFRTLFPLPILIMHSVFLGFMNAQNIPVGHGLVVAEIFAVMGVVWNAFGYFFVMCSVAPYGVVAIACLAEAFVIAAYAFIASVYRAGAGRCDRYLDTPLGDVGSGHGLPTVSSACGMQTANFVLSILVW